MLELAVAVLAAIVFVISLTGLIYLWHWVADKMGWE